MASIINATTTNGVAISADNSGILQLATNSGTTALTLSAAQAATFVSSVTATSLTAPILNSATTLSLQTNGSTTAVTIDASQNVGIGTASPITKLNVYGNTTTNTALVVSNASGNIGVFGNEATWLGIGSSNNLAISSFGSNSLLLGTAGAERMRIDSSGNVLINATATVQSCKLLLSDSANTFNLFVIKDTGTTGGAYVVFANSANNVAGSITHNGTTTVSYNSSSDYRLKENIVPMTGALEKVSKLKPVTYTWKNTDNELGEGFIAHELAEVCPIAVTGEKDAVDAEGNPKYQGIDTSFLVATLTAAIQELKAIIDTQQTQITLLNAKVGI